MTTAPAQESVARSTLWVLSTYLATATFTALLTLYLVRALGPDEFGLFSLAMGVGGLLAMPADAGIASSAARFVAERRGRPADMGAVIAAAVRLKLAAGGLVALGLILLAGPVAAAYDEPGLVWPLRGMALALLAQSLFGLFTGTLIAAGSSRKTVSMTLSESLFETLATVLLVLAGTGAAGAAFGRAIGYGLGVGVGAILLVRLLGSTVARVHRRPDPGVPPLARYAGVLLIVNGAYTVFVQLDVLIVGAVLSSAAVGAFSAPLRLTALLQYAGLAVGNAVSPRVAAATPEEAARMIEDALRLLLVVHALLVPPMLVWARPIVDLVLGGSYDESVGVLRAMAFVVYLGGLAPLVSMSVNYLGQAARRIPFAIGTVVVNVALDLLLIPVLGVAGAAVGTAVATAVYVGGHLWICRTLLDLRLRALVPTVLRTSLAAVAMAGVLLLFGTRSLGVVDWLAGGALATLAYAAVLLVLREVTPAEARELAGRLRAGS